MGMSLNSRSTGFTLIEVMVALAIFGVAVTSLTGTFQSNINNSLRLKDKTLATWVAQNKLVELKFANQAPSTTKKSEKVEFANRPWIVETSGEKTLQGILVKAVIDVKSGEENGDDGVLATLETFFVVEQ